MTGEAEYDHHQLQGQPYLILRLNRKPAVGPSHYAACSAAEACRGPQARSSCSRSRSSDSCFVSSPQMYAGRRGEVEVPMPRPKIEFSAVPSTRPVMAGGVAVQSDRSWCDTQRSHASSANTTRAVTCHLEGGAALITDGPSLLFAGRRTAPGGTCAAMQQHVQLFRDPTAMAAMPPQGVTSPVASGAARCRQARLQMLRGSGPLW
ncbi:hypothetical protein TraAM80_06565 [Trypanosoma rangeli]|uniref:Uncharacterized protein n=1 Tax=Trypanosoma rangeli TaxID=5698 RepID=A0A422N9K0_TRYRA|nr:uncharacterized protein TraAM80_06565 [Trypanosoma rangeli]RNF02140.1 hypothetical protein TraAM80_06565 [Trypanosoma rangeli]|eukprot:RNF02140.1 hypothetical protein TraAM80_06565 [Trypanosoma rangeli]